MTEAGFVYIVHGVMRADDAPRVNAIADMFAAGPVELIGEGRLLAAASRAPAEAAELFEEPAAVEKLAVAHNRILVAAAERADVAPLRLGGVYSDAGAVRALLREQCGAFEEILKRIEGAVEYVVDMRRVAAAGDASATPSASPVSSGRDYLRARGARRRSAERRRETYETFVDRAAARLADVSSGVIVETPAPGRTRLSALAARGPRPAFVQCVDALAEEAAAGDVELTVTGPWPAYSFVEGAHDRAAV